MCVCGNHARGPGYDFPLRHGADPLNVGVES
jgi:hypothetical protein